MAVETTAINLKPSFDRDGVPLMLQWSKEDIAQWVREELCLPQYEECFLSNFVTGRKLINIDASTLPRIGITDFNHIKLITSKIRELLGIEKPYWNRPISLPPRDPVSHFLERKSHTGKESDELSFGEHFRYLTKYSNHGDDE